MTDSYLTPGIYQHFKGKRYKVSGVATHSETGEMMVVYQCLYGDYSWWVRPLTMFTETVSYPDGQSGPRFKFLGPEDELISD